MNKVTPLTITEQVFSKHSGSLARSGSYRICDVDLVMASDTTGPLAIKAFEEMGGLYIAKPRGTVFILDHATPAPNQNIANLHSLIREFSMKQACLFHDIGEGICHQLIIENEYVKAGDLVLGADSHTCTYGAVGTISIGVGSTDLAAAMFTGKSWFRIPQTIKINLNGNLPDGVFAKDLILSIVGTLGAQGAVYKAIEFHGDFLEAISLSEKMTICNMVVEMGAKCGVICDSSTGLQSDAGAVIERYVEVDLSKLSPMVAKPHTVDNVCSIPEVEGIPIQQIFLGSCTNARVDDLRIAAKILEGRKIHPSVRFLVAPASKKILLQAIEEGIISTLLNAGATLAPIGCGACVGTHNGIPGDNENVLSTTNRNFKGRMGNNKACIYLASPATAAASSLTGKITDPRKMEA